MKSPKTAWLLYLLIALICSSGLLWLTRTSLLSERQLTQSIEAQQRALLEAQAAKQALVDEQSVSEALWLADSLISPILANESVVPWEHYLPLYKPTGNSGETLCSPLSVPSSELIQLHFQVDARENWKGPLLPSEAERTLAISKGMSEPKIDAAMQKLSLLQQICSFAKLEKLTPPTYPLGNRGDYWPDFGKETWPLQSNLDVRDIQDQQGRSRQQALNSVAAEVNQRSQQQDLSPRISVARSPSRVVWVEEHLLQIRKVIVDRRPIIQGIWLDWPTIESRLSKQLASRFPHIRLRPTSATTSSPAPRQLVSLPVVLDLPSSNPSLESSPQTTLALRPFDVRDTVAWSLVLAWSAFGISLAGTAWLLHRSLLLSARRATFVSAVTHELRTPLTTFQLYTDLLLSQSELTQEKQQGYFHTLKTQADRLARLVENVLAYSQLEGSHRPPVLSARPLQEWLEGIEPGLREMVARYQAQLEIVYSPQDGDPPVLANQDLLEQLLLNLVENACKYGLTSQERTVKLEGRFTHTYAEVDIVDHGAGIPEAFRRNLFRPFSRSAEQAAGNAPGIGLGLSLAKRLAKLLRGSLDWVADQEPGTRFRIRLRTYR